MKRNGYLTAHSRKWPLYERQEVRDGRVVMVMLQPPEDRIEKERLDRHALANELKRLGLSCNVSNATARAVFGIRGASY